MKRILWLLLCTVLLVSSLPVATAEEIPITPFNTVYATFDYSAPEASSLNGVNRRIPMGDSAYLYVLEQGGYYPKMQVKGQLSDYATDMGEHPDLAVAVQVTDELLSVSLGQSVATTYEQGGTPPAGQTLSVTCEPPELLTVTHHPKTQTLLVQGEQAGEGQLVFSVGEQVLARRPISVYTLGDPDGDGTVTAADALQILRQVVGKTVFSSWQQKAALLDEDSSVTATDGLAVLRRVVGKDARFPAEYQDTLPLDEAHFPDPRFRAVLAAKYDLDHSGGFSPYELQQTTDISTNTYGVALPENLPDKIADLTGLERFTHLKKLLLTQADVKWIDLRCMTRLEDLQANSVGLSLVEPCHCPHLVRLELYQNHLNALNVTQNQALERLDLGSNHIRQLDLSQNPLLKILVVNYNPLGDSLDLTHNPNLTTLQCMSTEMTKLTLSYHPRLAVLKCSNNPLTELNVTDLRELWFLECENNQLTQLNVEQNPVLERLYCDGNALTRLDVTRNPLLEQLSCRSNQISELNLTANPKLNYLDCRENPLTRLDLTANPKLTKPNCDQGVEIIR